MLRAVVFSIIGVGFYSLFIAPLNSTTAFGVESLSDLEFKIFSVVIVILAVFLAALVLFHCNGRSVNEFSKERPQKEMFEKKQGQSEIKSDEIKSANNAK